MRRSSESFYVSHTVGWNFWNDHVLGWWEHKDDPNVFFLKYEDLQKVCWSDVCIFTRPRLLLHYFFPLLYSEIKVIFSRRHAISSMNITMILIMMMMMMMMMILY